MGTHTTQNFFAKNLSNTYSQKLLDSTKKIYNRCKKTALKRAIQIIAEAIGDLIDNKTADKITRVSKNNLEDKAKNEIEIPKKRYISPEERQHIIDELRLA